MPLRNVKVVVAGSHTTLHVGFFPDLNQGDH
jgi:hypothetical protein